MRIAHIEYVPDVIGGYSVWYQAFLNKCLELGVEYFSVPFSYLGVENYDYNWSLNNNYPNSELLINHVKVINPDIILIGDSLKKLPKQLFDTFKIPIVWYPHDISTVCKCFGYNNILDCICPNNSISTDCYKCIAQEYKEYKHEEFYLTSKEWTKYLKNRFKSVHAVFVSEFMKNFFGAKNFRSNTVIPNGIDIPKSKSLRAKGSKKILIVSNWSDKDDSLEWMSKKLKQAVKHGFTFYSTSYENDVITKVPKVLERKNIKNLYKGYDIYLSFFPYKESYSLALAEASNFGLATVVLSSTGATIERNPTAVIEDFYSSEELINKLTLVSSTDVVPRYEGSMFDNLDMFFKYLESIKNNKVGSIG